MTITLHTDPAPLEARLDGVCVRVGSDHYGRKGGRRPLGGETPWN